MLRKISSTGAIQWTRTVGSIPSTFPRRGAVSVFEPNTETIATVFRNANGVVQMQLRDSDGNSLDAFELTDPVYLPYTMASDPQAAVLIGGAYVGSSVDEILGDLWLARHALDGAEIWSTDLNMGWDPDRLAISSVAVGPNGAAYAAGWHDVVTDGWARATLWVARIEL
jgi:hypothetical protein